MSVDEPLWARDEIAWPLGLLSGFLGAWVGFQARLPGAATLLACGLFAPLVVPLLGRGERRLASLVTVGWWLGIAGAAIGLSLEGGRGLAAAVPGAGALRAALGPALFPPAAGAAPGLVLTAHLALWALVLGLARVGLGLGGLLLIAHAAAATGVVVGEAALAAVQRGASPLLAAAVLWPPYLAVELAALSLACVATARPAGASADPDSSAAPAQGLELPRSSHLWALAVGGAALAIGLFGGEAWGRWASSVAR